MADKKEVNIYALQSLFICGVTLVSQSFKFGSSEKLIASVGRYVFYALCIVGSKEACVVGYEAYHNKTADIIKLLETYRTYLVLFVSSVTLLIANEEKLFKEDFLFIYCAYLLFQYFKMDDKLKKPQNTINYGVGMACSFFEGYLVHIIPSDGAKFVGFEENIRAFEARQGVIFPVKMLFLVVTKSLFCPPDMKACNKPNRTDLPYLEACQSLEDIEKDVAGVKNRTYRNSAYKIHRPGVKTPVYVTAEFASPLHTLFRVVQNRTLYEELVDADVPKIVDDFCNTLTSIIKKSPECRNKCVLVHYDDNDPNQNLADILLDKIREIEPKFEDIIAKKS